MPNKPLFTIKNWKLASLAFLFICLFIALGCWQTWRAQEKEYLLDAFSKRTLHAPLAKENLANSTNTRFYRFQLTGTFDNQHTFLLDNKIYHRQVGYHVYTPFRVEGKNVLILVNRGFIAAGTKRSILPVIRPLLGKVTFTSMLDLAPAHVALGQMTESTLITWPLRIEFIDIAKMSTLLNSPLVPYILIMDPKDARAYSSEWIITTMLPERHRAYAVQWFALALTLLILFVALNRPQ